MTQTANDVLAAALSLSEKERGVIAARLLESIGPDELKIHEGSEAEFNEELLRRARELNENPSIGIPVDSFQSRSRVPRQAATLRLDPATDRWALSDGR
jgi:putative addiction module component (TIGR02574 family)